jgi:hypothetical protein
MFDEAFGAADEASLAMMGEDIAIAGNRKEGEVYEPAGMPTRAVRDEGEYLSQLGDGGYSNTRNCSFYLLTTEAKRTSAAHGSRVITAKDEWLVSMMRDLGTMTLLICISTSGQATPEF